MWIKIRKGLQQLFPYNAEFCFQWLFDYTMVAIYPNRVSRIPRVASNIKFYTGKKEAECIVARKNFTLQTCSQTMHVLLN